VSIRSPRSPEAAAAAWRAHRVPALDGVRGVAMVLVLCAHFALDPRATAIDQTVHGVMLLGYTGLDLFFVLSGFLITGVLLDARDTPHRVRNFYVRRGLRVLPLYYGVVVALVVVFPLFRPGGTPALDTLRHNQWWYWFHATNFIWRRPGAMPYNTGHFWSLAVEEQFYLIWPWLVFRLSPKTLLRVCLGCVVGALVCRIVVIASGSGEWVASYVWTRMDTLAAGSAVAILLRYPPTAAGFAPYRRWIAVAGIGTGVLAAVSFLATVRWPALTPLHNTVGFSCVALCFGAFVAAASQGWMDGLVTRPVFRFFGKYSYGMYVFHLPMLLKFGAVYALVDRIPLVAGSGLLRQAAFFAIATACTATLGVLSWHCYERHFLALKRFFPAGKPARAMLHPSG
jgi:peptidoglycan/LPS O-acetylase OafA/YrhL